jgi:polysaccharide export outer membrane protein
MHAPQVAKLNETRISIVYTNSSIISPSIRALSRLLLFVVISSFGVYAVAQNDVSLAASGATDAQPATQSIVGEDYTISPDDILDIYVVDVAELSRAFRVSPSGTINLPFVGAPLPGAGLTLPQLADSIKEALRARGVVTNALVTVSVQQSRLHSVAVTGAVKHPQIYPLFGRTTLLDVISQAEGLADDAGGVASVHRGEFAIKTLGLNSLDDSELTLRVDIKNVLEGGESNANVVIYPGDRVMIPRAGIVYVVGAVNKPGGYTIRTNRAGMTVMQAVALAENVKSTARRDRAMIVRVDAQAANGRTQIPVNLKQVMSGKTPDLTLQTEDILFVPDSTSKKALQKGFESVVQITSGLAIYAAH